MGSRFITAKLTAISAMKLNTLKMPWAAVSDLAPSSDTTSTTPITPDSSDTATRPVTRSPKLIHTRRTKSTDCAAPYLIRPVTVSSSTASKISPKPWYSPPSNS